MTIAPLAYEAAQVAPQVISLSFDSTLPPPIFVTVTDGTTRLAADICALTSAPQSYISHKVKKNETLGMIARKYGVPVPRLRAANGLKASLIRDKMLLRVPVATRGPTGPGPRLRVPARRLPPTVAAGAPAADAALAQPPPTK